MNATPVVHIVLFRAILSVAFSSCLSSEFPGLKHETSANVHSFQTLGQFYGSKLFHIESRKTSLRVHLQVY